MHGGDLFRGVIQQSGCPQGRRQVNTSILQRFRESAVENVENEDILIHPVLRQGYEFLAGEGDC